MTNITNLKVIEIVEIKSPCRNCEEVHRRCRTRCKKLRDFLRWLDNNPTIGFGIADTTNDGYRLLLK